MIRDSGVPESAAPAAASKSDASARRAGAGGLARRPVLANTGALVVLRGSNLAVRLGLLFLIARQVPPESFGHLVLSLAVVEVAKVLADFGMDTLAIREYAVPRPPGELATFTASFAALRAMCALLVQAGVLAWLALAEPRAIFGTGLVLSFTVWTALLQGYSLDWFQGRLRVARALVPALAVNIACGLAAAGLLARLPGLPAKAACLPALELCAGLVLLAVLRRDPDWAFGRPSRRVARALALGGVPIVVTGTLIMVYSRLDVFVMAGRLPAVDVGRYGIAYRFTEPFQIAAAVFGLSVYSRFGSFLQPGAGHARTAALRYAAGTLAYGATAALALATLAPPLITRFLPAYSGAIPPLRILAASLLFRSLNATLAGIIQAAGRFRGLAALAGWNLVLVFGLLTWLVPRLGMPGAPLALLIGEGVNSLIQVAWVARIVSAHERTAVAPAGDVRAGG